MTASIARPSDFIVAISVAVVVHVLVFLGFAGLVAWGFLTGKLSTESLQSPSVAVTVEIRPEMFERVAPSALEEEVKQRLMKTTPAQESEEAPENAPYIGERNTKAASELEPDPDGPAVPSQDGRDQRNPEDVSTFDSDFVDGEEEGSTLPPSPATPPAGDPALQPADPAEPTAEGEEAPETPPAPPGGTEGELMKSETQIPVPAPDSEEIAEEPVPEEATEERPEEKMEERPEELPKKSESKPEPQSENQPGGAPDSVPEEETPPKESGFQTETRKTKLRGSIGRKGTAALDVEDSPVGRYQVLLSRAVEREWQKNCIQYRDHITPGYLTIRFLLDEQGTASGFRFLEVMENGEIQQGFTLKAIQQADIPPMPKEIVKELNGDPLELIYNFYF